MNKLKKQVLKGILKLATANVNPESKGWPPLCVGYIYQPKRPKLK